MSTALATRDDQGLAALLSTPITTPVDYSRRLQQFAQHQVHLLSPFSSLSGLAPQHEIQPVQTFLNADPSSGDVYGGLPWLRNTEVAPAKNGLLKIADAFGARLTPHFVSVGTIRNYWHISFTIEYRDIDGTMQVRTGSQEWDLRTDSDRLKGWTERQITEGRKNGLRQCETRAINAAIRQCGGGMKQKYTAEELQRPFVVFRVVFKPDMSDPMQRRMITERALAGTSALYRPSLPAAYDTIDTTTGEVLDAEVSRPQDREGSKEASHAREATRPVGDERLHTDGQSAQLAGGQSGATVSARSEGGQADQSHAAGPTTATVTSDTPPGATAVRIVGVKEFKAPAGKGDWVRYEITDSTGRMASTFSAGIAKAARSFASTQAWVDVTTQPKESNGKTYLNVVEIAPASADLDFGPEPGNDERY